MPTSDAVRPVRPSSPPVRPGELNFSSPSSPPPRRGANGELSAPEATRLAQPKRANSHPAKHLDSPGGRGVRAVTCRNCRTPVLRGLDDDWCAGYVEVDLTPLSAVGEALAVLGGRRTYRLHRYGRQYQLTRRAWFGIKQYPAGKSRLSMKWDVVATHCCHDATLHPFAIPSVFALVERKAETSECPY